MWTMILHYLKMLFGNERKRHVQELENYFIRFGRSSINWLRLVYRNATRGDVERGAIPCRLWALADARHGYTHT